ncbi:MAG: WbqC family protein [Tenuifilaceae bacterium]
MENRIVILSTAYLPPIQYFAKLTSYSKVIIEVHDTYSKQSYRNRCNILGSNGQLSLSIPVIRRNGNHTQVKDIKIDYSTNWQKNHWKAIESSYRTSVYYDFVEDIISPFYRKQEPFLIDFNTKLTIEILQFLGIDKSIQMSQEFIKEYPSNYYDSRGIIHPKPQYQLDDKHFETKEYFQVFNNKFTFVPNLSILDLIFNEGLNSISILESSIKK